MNRNDKKNLSGKLLSLLITAAGILALSGCANAKASQASEAEAPKEIVPTGILVPAAEFTQIDAEQALASEYCCWVGDCLIYKEYTFVEEQKMGQETIWQAPLYGSSDRTALYAPQPGIFTDLFFTDQTDSLYLLCRETSPDVPRCFLRKQDASGQEIYSVDLGEELSGMAENTQYGAEGCADSQGRSVIRGQDGTLYFFDADGQYSGSCATEMTSGKFLDAGEDDIYLWQQDYNAYTHILLQKVDMEKRAVLSPITLDLEKALGTYYNCRPLSGYENGILLTATSALYQYDQNSGEVTQLLDWTSPSLSIDGYQVQEIRFVQTANGADPEHPAMELLLYDQGFSTGDSAAETALVSYIDQAYLPKREKVVLGSRSGYSYSLDRIIRQFNRNSKEYYVELKEYDDYQLEETLMYGGKEVPDMLDLCQVTPQLLAGLGLLEDLEPYFAESTLLSHDDFLDAFWEAGKIDGKMTGAVISFSFGTYFTTSESMPPDGWDMEDLLQLSAKNPDNRILYYQTSDTLFSLLFRQDQFIDWSRGTCSFDSPEFTALLETIISIPEPADNPTETSYRMDDLASQFVKGEYLLGRNSFSSPYNYQSIWGNYRNKIYNIGFPTSGDEACFRMDPTAELAIYSESSCKEGAWAFIEYLLTEEAQTWYGSSYRGFPVRRDAFEAYLARRYHPVYTFQGDIHLAENDELFYYMAEHMKCESSVYYSPIGDIISEELPAFFNGDKTAKEVAQVIQSRAQLYLDER